MARKLPEVPAASLADIAFMILIFFLVTATMDSDLGLERRLPPMAPPDQQTDDIAVKERNIFVVLVDRNNRLMVEGNEIKVNELKAKTKEFLTNPNDLPDLPEKEMKDLPFFGNIPVETENAVISLRNDDGTSYGTYIIVQNELLAAINELRDDLAKEKFGKKYDALEEDKQKPIDVIYPKRISEAEPKRRIGGKK